MFEFAEAQRITTEKELGNGFWSWVVFINNMRSFKKCYDDSLFLEEYMYKSHKDYKDEYLYKNIVQNNYVTGFDNCYSEHLNKLKRCKDKVISYLISVDNPYYHIFNPIWFKKDEAYKKGYYPYKEDCSGVNDVTLFVAGEYAKQNI